MKWLMKTVTSVSVGSIMKISNELWGVGSIIWKSEENEVESGMEVKWEGWKGIIRQESIAIMQVAFRKSNSTGEKRAEAGFHFGL